MSGRPNTFSQLTLDVSEASACHPRITEWQNVDENRRRLNDRKIALQFLYSLTPDINLKPQN